MLTVIIGFITSVLFAVGGSWPFYFLVVSTPTSFILPDGAAYRVVPVILRYSALLVLVCTVALRRQSVRNLFWGDTLSKLLILWWLTAVVSVVITGNVSEATPGLLLLLGSLLAFFFVCRARMQSRQTVLTCCRLLAIGVFVSGVLGVFQVVSGSETLVFRLLHGFSIDVPDYAIENLNVGRAMGLCASGPNNAAAYLNLLLPLSIGMLCYSWPGRRRIWQLMVVLSGCVGILLSGSRGGIAALGVTCLIAFVVFTENRKKLIAAVTAFLVLVPVLTAGIVAFVPRLTDVDEVESVFSRYAIWGEAIQLFQEHPIVGIGIGNFRFSYNPILTHEAIGSVDTHNIYLQELTETGVLGLGVFLALCGYVLIMGFRSLRRFRRGSLQHALAFGVFAATSSVLVHGMVDSPLMSGPEIPGALAIVFAVMSVIEKLDTNDDNLALSPIRANSQIVVASTCAEP